MVMKTYPLRIVIQGSKGTGKTTLQRFIREALKAEGMRVQCFEGGESGELWAVEDEGSKPSLIDSKEISIVTDCCGVETMNRMKRKEKRAMARFRPARPIRSVVTNQQIKRVYGHQAVSAYMPILVQEAHGLMSMDAPCVLPAGSMVAGVCGFPQERVCLRGEITPWRQGGECFF